MKIGQTVQDHDLAATLRNDSGTFLCQQGGQSYVVVAKPGHSIALGPLPIGRRLIEFPFNQSSQAEPWVVTKLSSEDISGEYTREETRVSR